MASILTLVGVLFGLAWLLAPFVGLFLGWQQRRAIQRLQQRLQELEQRLDRSTIAGPPEEAPVGSPTSEASAPAVPEPPAPEAPAPDPSLESAWADALPPPPLEPDPQEPVRELPPPRELPSLERVSTWVAAAVGGAALVVATLFALAEAVEKGWLLPSVRVSAALVTGTLAWGLGTMARGRGHAWAGSALAGSGAGILYGGLWAGASLYGLFPVQLAWGLMTLVTVVAVLHAARLGDRLLAWLGLLGGLLTPVLLSQGDNRPLPLFVWLTLLACGISWVALKRRWPALLVGAAVGVGALFVAWTAQWYTADQAPFALLGVGAISLPFAAASASHHPALRRCAWTILVAFGLLALPWVGPVDAVFYDPRNGERLVRLLPRAAGISALAVVLLPLAPWLFARRGDHWQGGVAGSLIAGLALIHAITWAQGDAPSWSGALAGAGALGLGTLVSIRRPSLAMGLFLLPLIAGCSLAVATASGSLHGGAFAVGTAAVALSGFALARTASGWVLPTALVGVLLPLWAAALEPTRVGTHALLGPTLLTLALYSQAPALVAWRAHPRASLGTAAFSGLLLLPPLLAGWSHAVSPDLLGIVPVLVAANTLLAAGVLVRGGRLRRTDAVLGLFVAAVLFGASAAVPLQLGGRWLTIAWALEMAGLAAFARRVPHPVIRAFAVALAVILGVRLLLNPFALDYGPSAGLPFVNWTIYTWGLPLACFVAAWRWWPVRDRARDLFGGLAVLVGFALVEMQVRQSFGNATPAELGGHAALEGMVRSLSWAAYGLGVLGLGALRRHRALRLAGFAFVLLAMVRVFAVDLWALQGFARVGSIGGIAITLLLAAFTFERLVLGSNRAEDR